MRVRDFTQCNSQSQFIGALFERRARIDKRDWLESRPAEVSFDRHSSAALAQLGTTRVMCAVEWEVGSINLIHSIQILLDSI